MGECFIITNPVKRQYFTIDPFGENSKKSGLITGNNSRSLHAIAVAWLILDTDSEARATSFLGELQGTWFGDRIYLAGDEAPPNPDGVQTSCDGAPMRNLFRLALDEFEDITPRVVAETCERDEDILHFLVHQAYAARSSGADNFLLREFLDVPTQTFRRGCD